MPPSELLPFPLHFFVANMPGQVFKLDVADMLGDATTWHLGNGICLPPHGMTLASTSYEPLKSGKN